MIQFIQNFILKKYKNGDSQVFQEAQALTYIMLGLSILTGLISIVVVKPIDKVLLLGMSLMLLLLLMFVRSGYAKLAGIITVAFLSLCFAGLVMKMAINSYFDMYMIAFLEIFVLFITLLITTEALHSIASSTIGVLALLFNFFFRAMPAQLEGNPPPLDDLIISIILIIFASLIVISSNRRGRKLLHNIKKESQVNEKRAQKLKIILDDLSKDFNTSTKLVKSSELMSSTIDEMKEMVLEIRNEMNKLTGSSMELSRASETILTSSQSVSKASENQSAVIEETSAAITEMSSAIDSISRIAEERKRSVQNLSNSASNAETVLSQSSKAMESLKELVNSLEDVNKVISSISAQTGLLAMNAAIEAAHAGDAGRGFAVVADEVRKLSDDSSTNAKNISIMLKEISGSIEGAAGINMDVTSQFHNIREEISSVVTGMDEILSGVSELSAGSAEINTGTAQSVETTAEVRIGVDEVNINIESISKGVESQQARTEAVLRSVEMALRMLDTVEKTSQAVKKVGELNAKNLQKLSKNLHSTEESI